MRVLVAGLDSCVAHMNRPCSPDLEYKPGVGSWPRRMGRITAYGGVNEIGGNRLLVETDVRVFLDFGTSYKVLGRYFHEYLKPRKVSGLKDYFRMGLAPDLPGLYRDDLLVQMGRKAELPTVDAIVLSHPHLDHAGLFPLVKGEIPIMMAPASKAILKTLEDTGSTSQLSDYVTVSSQFQLRPAKTGPPRLIKADGGDIPAQPRKIVTEPRLDLGQTEVRAWAVDHSIPGARGTIVESRDLTIAYTGDLRLHGRRKQDTERFLKQAAGVGVLLTEGTNLGSETPRKKRRDSEEVDKFIPEPDVAKRIADFIDAADGYCFVNYPNRDLDRLLSFYGAAQKAGRRLLLTTKQAHMLDLLRQQGVEVPSLDDPNLGVYLPLRGFGLIERPEKSGGSRELIKKDYQWYEADRIGKPYTFTPSAVRADPSAFLVHVDYYNLTELVELDPPKGTYIFSKTEPFDDEMEIDQERLQRWIARFNLKLERAHASGHASPEDLWFAIDQIQARRILPIHTENVRAFETKYPGKVQRVEYGKAVTV